MNHSFLVIDNQLLVAGSWTAKCIPGNLHNAIVTSNNNLIDIFTSEYNRAWNILKTMAYQIGLIVARSTLTAYN